MLMLEIIIPVLRKGNLYPTKRNVAAILAVQRLSSLKVTEYIRIYKIHVILYIVSFNTYAYTLHTCIKEDRIYTCIVQGSSVGSRFLIVASG